MILLALDVDFGADLVLVGEEGEVGHEGELQQLNYERLRKWSESFGLPPF